MSAPAPFDPFSLPHPAVAVDVILFTVLEGQLRVLLIRRELPPYEGQWALPGGFVRVDESLDEAAARELDEEAGVRVGWLEQLYTFGAVDRDPLRRVISVAYFALIDAAALDPRAGGDATEVKWCNVRRLPKLAFDHKRIVRYAHQRLKYKTEYAPVAFQLLPDAFALSELRHVYEVIHGRALDKRNFRRKVLGLNVLEPTGDERREGRGRPAALYRFRDKRFDDLGGGVVLDF